MSQLSIAVVVGSIRKDSFNRQFAEALVKLLPADVKASFVRIDDLPLYDQDADASAPAPAVARLRAEIKAASAVLFVTPEYNRSMPGVLKNVIDWGSRPYGQNVWAGKPAAVAGTSPGHVATAVCQSHLRSILTMLGMVLASQPEVYIVDRPGLLGDDGAVSDESTEKFLLSFVARFAEWIGGTK